MTDHEPDTEKTIILRPLTPAAANVVVITAAVPAQLDLDRDEVRAPVERTDAAVARQWGAWLTQDLRACAVPWLARALTPNPGGWTHLIHIPIASGRAADFVVRASGIPADEDEAALVGFVAADFDLDRIVSDLAGPEDGAPTQ